MTPSSRTPSSLPGGCKPSHGPVRSLSPAPCREGSRWVAPASSGPFAFACLLAFAAFVAGCAKLPGAQTDDPALAASGSQAGAVSPSTPDAGLVTYRSNAGFAATLARAEPAIQARGLFLMRVVDHSAAATQFGRQLAPNTVVLFGHPRVGSQVMACAPTAGIDLPQKLLLLETPTGVTVTYNDPAYLVRRHRITGCEDILATVAETLDAIAREVAGAS